MGRAETRPRPEASAPRGPEEAPTRQGEKRGRLSLLQGTERLTRLFLKGFRYHDDEELALTSGAIDPFREGQVD